MAVAKVCGVNKRSKKVIWHYSTHLVAAIGKVTKINTASKEVLVFMQIYQCFDAVGWAAGRASSL